MTDTDEQIRRQIEKARARWGWSVELKLIVDNWGDTLGNGETLRALHSFTRTGRFF